ncbi:MAG TPA: MFS transporter [Nitrososphaerales archaeon]|nr:MFS transporter [Nitrososphaerales archaeon]
MTQVSEESRSPLLGRTSVLVLTVMSFGYAVYAADRTVLSSVLAPLASTLNLSNNELGLLGSAQYLGVLTFVFIAGHLSDRYGKWFVVTVGVVVFTSFTWLIGLSTNFLEAFLFRLVSGFGEGMFWPVAMATVANHFRGRKGLALGIFYVGFDVGSVAGLSIGGITYSLTGDWRPAFFVAPLLGLLIIAGAIVTNRKTGSSFGEDRGIRLGKDMLQLVRNKNATLLMLFAFLATWASVWQVVFLPYYFFKVMHFTILSSALLSAAVTASGACGKILLGGVSDRLRRNRLLVAISVAALLSYALFFESSNFTLDMIGALSMGFFSAAIFPIMQALMSDSCGLPKRTGTALGLTTSAQSVATVISPAITASLFFLGVGRILALDAMIPAALTIIVALFLKEPRLRVISN